MAKPSRISASELDGREVMDLRAGEVIGAVTDFCLTREGVVTQIGVLPLQWFRGGKGIAPAAVTNITSARLSIEDAASLGEFSPDGTEQLSYMFDNVLGKDVLQQDGEYLGSLADFYFDAADGRITHILVADNGQPAEIAVARVQTIGKSYMVVEREGAEPGPKPAASSPATEGAAPSARAADAPVATPPALDERAAYYEAPALDAPPPAAVEAAPAAAAILEPAVAEPEAAAEAAPAVLEAEELLPPGPAFEDDLPVEQELPPAAEEISAPYAPPEPVAAPEPAREERPRRSRRKAEPEPAAEPAPAVFEAEEPVLWSEPSPAQLDFGAEAAAPALPEAAAAAPVAEAAPDFSVLGLSAFDRRKAEYLFGKAAHTELRGDDGLIAAKGARLDMDRLRQLVEQGLLTRVFLEMTSHRHNGS